MKIILCVKRDILGCLFLNKLLPLLSGHEICVWLSDKTRAQEDASKTLSEIAYVERGFPVDKLFPLVDRLKPSSGDVAYRTFRGLSDFYGIPCSVIPDINAPDVIEDMRSIAPDLIVSARFSYIFKSLALSIPTYGVLNIHPGELPRYAGLFAPMRMVLENAGKLASTLHWIDDGIDTGPVLSRYAQDYNGDRGLLNQIGELYLGLIPTLVAIVGRCAEGTREIGLAQERELRRYQSMPSEESLSEFLSRGNSFYKPDEYRHLLSKFVPSASQEAVDFLEAFGKN